MKAPTDNTQNPPQDPPTKPPARFEIGRDQLPLHCPLDEHSLWNTHPRVFLPIEETGEAVCPYCGTEYVLKE